MAVNDVTNNIMTRARKSGGAFLPNLEPLIAAGIDPKTGLPARVSSGLDLTVVDNVKLALRVRDGEQASLRYIWKNIPCNITSQFLERTLYYRGQLCFYKDPNNGKFYFMPYALDGTIDFYGRYNRVHPLPLTAGVDSKDPKAREQMAYLTSLKLDCVYTKPDERYPIENPDKVCAILQDYTNQLAPTIIPRQQINDVFNQLMANCVGYSNTNLLMSTGVHGVRVGSADEADRVYEASRQLKVCALTGNPYLPIEGTTVEMQELGVGQLAKSEEYFLAMKSIDNIRLSTYGIDNGGLYEKKAQELESEAAINGGPTGLVMDDGLRIRQNFCDVVNAIWPEVNLSVEVNEAIDPDMGLSAIYKDGTQQAQPGQEMENTDDTNE